MHQQLQFKNIKKQQHQRMKQNTTTNNNVATQNTNINIGQLGSESQLEDITTMENNQQIYHHQNKKMKSTTVRDKQFNSKTSLPEHKSNKMMTFIENDDDDDEPHQDDMDEAAYDEDEQNSRIVHHKQISMVDTDLSPKQRFYDGGDYGDINEYGQLEDDQEDYLDMDLNHDEDGYCNSAAQFGGSKKTTAQTSIGYLQSQQQQQQQQRPISDIAYHQEESSYMQPQMLNNQFSMGQQPRSSQQRAQWGNDQQNLQVQPQQMQYHALSQDSSLHQIRSSKDRSINPSFINSQGRLQHQNQNTMMDSDGVHHLASPDADNDCYGQQQLQQREYQRRHKRHVQQRHIENEEDQIVAQQTAHEILEVDGEGIATFDNNNQNMHSGLQHQIMSDQETANQQIMQQYLLHKAMAFDLDDSLQNVNEQEEGQLSSARGRRNGLVEGSYSQAEQYYYDQQNQAQFSARVNSTDTGINTQAVLAMNDAMRFEDKGVDTNAEQSLEAEIRNNEKEQEEKGFDDEQEGSDDMSHEEDRLLLLETEDIHDTTALALLNSLPTSKHDVSSMQQTQNFSGTAELARALNLAQNSNTGLDHQRKGSLRENHLQPVREKERTIRQQSGNETGKSTNIDMPFATTAMMNSINKQQTSSGYLPADAFNRQYLQSRSNTVTNSLNSLPPPGTTSAKRGGINQTQIHVLKNDQSSQLAQFILNTSGISSPTMIHQNPGAAILYSQQKPQIQYPQLQSNQIPLPMSPEIIESIEKIATSQNHFNSGINSPYGNIVGGQIKRVGIGISNHKDQKHETSIMLEELAIQINQQKAMAKEQSTKSVNNRDKTSNSQLTKPEVQQDNQQQLLQVRVSSNSKPPVSNFDQRRNTDEYKSTMVKRDSDDVAKNDDKRCSDSKNSTMRYRSNPSAAERRQSKFNTLVINQRRSPPFDAKRANSQDGQYQMLYRTFDHQPYQNGQHQATNNHNANSASIGRDSNSFKRQLHQQQQLNVVDLSQTHQQSKNNNNNPDRQSNQGNHDYTPNRRKQHQRQSDVMSEAVTGDMAEENQDQQIVDDGQEEVLSDIIHRLRRFSPQKIKQNLTATYLANNESLKLTITSLEKQRDEFQQSEEHYKNRIRALQFENITKNRQNEHLLIQCNELGRFFKFLQRCRKRLKKVLHAMGSQACDQQANAKTTGEDHLQQYKNKRNRSADSQRNSKSNQQNHSNNNVDDMRKRMKIAITDEQYGGGVAAASTRNHQNHYGGLSTTNNRRAQQQLNNMNASGINDTLMSPQNRTFNGGANSRERQHSQNLHQITKGCGGQSSSFLQINIGNENEVENNQEVMNSPTLKQQQSAASSLVNQANDLKLQFRVLLDRLKLQVKVNEKVQEQKIKEQARTPTLKQTLDLKMAELDHSKILKEKESFEAQLKEVSAQNVRLEQKLELKQEELHNLQLTIGQQARRLKQYSDKEKENCGIQELLQSLQKLEVENQELKELVDTLQMRDKRLDKVDQMQSELENLMRKTDEEKKNFKIREDELMNKIKIKDMELKKIYYSIQDTDYNRLENLRKDHVIENMQATFTMVLQRAMQKIRQTLELPKTSNIPTARMEICLDELLRTFQVEIDTLQACFKPSGLASLPQEQQDERPPPKQGQHQQQPQDLHQYLQQDLSRPIFAEVYQNNNYSTSPIMMYHQQQPQHQQPLQKSGQQLSPQYQNHNSHLQYHTAKTSHV